MVWVFWGSLAIVAYVYTGYPLLLAVWRRFRPRPRSSGRTPGSFPRLSIVIAARNEGHLLDDRINNLLSLDYPPDRRQIIVVSDGSTDDTPDILARHRTVVDAVCVPAGGKARALNAGVQHARHDIVVFADARQAFARDALRELVLPFRDPQVGVVSGELLLAGESKDRRIGPGDRRNESACDRPEDVDRRTGAERRRTVASTIADGLGLYWQYEKRIRRDESAIHSTLGATGAIYAIRRSLWKPLPPDTILDDVLAPMRAVLAGSRSVFNDRARAFDRPAADANAEARRKTRTLAGNYQLFWLEPRLLLPWRNPVWFQFASHKVGRLVVPFALAGLLLSSAALAPTSPFYLAAFAGQLFFYTLAVYGAWLDELGAGACRAVGSSLLNRLARISLTFLVLNGSAVAGLGVFLSGRKVWR